jgi:hypothetical protein
MSDETVKTGEPGTGTDTDDASNAHLHEPMPDESVLMGKVGVEAEVLAELARAEAKISDPLATDDDPDAEGAQL